MAVGSFAQAIIPDSNRIALTATAAAIEAFIRVKYDSNGLISKAAAAEQAIGVTEEYIAASGIGFVRRFAPMVRFTALNALARGSMLTNTANGKVDDAAGVSAYNGYAAYEAANADNDVIGAFRLDTPLTLTTGSAMAALASYGTGAYGLDSSANMQALFNKVEAIAGALVTAGIIKQGA